MMRKWTSKVESLPEDLRQVAEEMLSAKFPDDNPFIDISKWKTITDENPMWKVDWGINTTVKAEEAEPLTMAKLQEAFDLVKINEKVDTFKYEMMSYWYESPYVTNPPIIQKHRNYGKSWMKHDWYKEAYEKMMVDSMALSTNPMLVISHE